MELQKKVQAAVLTGKGWEDAFDLRKQAESRGSPASSPSISADRGKLDQPLFVIRARSTRVPPHHAEKLGAMANARKNAPKTEVVVLPGINHLPFGKDRRRIEYSSLPDRTVSPEVARRSPPGSRLP